jgi:luciferase family oxidoreductase group 1
MLLSVLDILSPVHIPRLVRELDTLGYHRFWATEHHSPAQSASPTLVTCLAAAMTARMRIGTAGILLNYACPAKVTEDFRLLELYFPGRIDLGVAGASGIAHEHLHLDGGSRPTRASYAARVRALVDLVRGDTDAVFGPVSSTRPALWLCGSSVESAVLAGTLGMHFACHHLMLPSSEAARPLFTAYRDSYRGHGEPYTAIAMYGACAETEAAARRVWANDAARACFSGTPPSCVEQLHEIVARSQADEAVINLFIEDIDTRIRGYQLLAEAAELDIEPDEPEADSRETALA